MRTGDIVKIRLNTRYSHTAPGTIWRVGDIGKSGILVTDGNGFWWVSKYDALPVGFSFYHDKVK